jgi:hypothetical protein
MQTKRRDTLRDSLVLELVKPFCLIGLCGAEFHRFVPVRQPEIVRDIVSPMREGHFIFPIDLKISPRDLFPDILRWICSLIPSETEFRTLRGPIRGMKWVKGAGPNAYWIGTYEVARLREFSDAVNPGDVAYDVAANVGIYSLHARARAERAGRVYSFVSPETHV